MKEKGWKEHFQKILEEDKEEGIDQLTLSHYFMNRAKNLSAYPSTGTHLTRGATTTRKRSRRLWTKSAAYSTPVMEKARAIEASLQPKHSSFVKFLSHSHVTSGLMSIGAWFCRKYLLNHDHTIQLEGENGVQYDTRFLAQRQGLSGGWRRFSDDHNFQQGDALVFHLVEQCKFKVYAVRANNLDQPVQERQQASAVEEVNVCQNMDNNPVEQTACVEKNCQNDSQSETDYDLGDEGFIFENDEEDSPREIMEDGSSSKSFVDLKNFSIVVNGVCMDSQFSTSARVKYYELCRARKSYLHDGFPKTMNCMLAVGIILGIVSVSDDIKASTLHTSLAEFEGWGKTLASFQHFGMDFGFLQERLREMSRLATEFQGCSEANRHSKVLNEEDELRREIESVEKRLMELKEAAANLRGEREALDAYFKTSNLTFQEIAKRPW